MTQSNRPQSKTKNAITGFINTALELKFANNDRKTPYVSFLLGQGKDKQGNFLPAYQMVAYNDAARLLAAECKKGDRILVTEFNLFPAKNEADEKYGVQSVFKLAIERFERLNSTRTAPQEQQAAPAQNQAPVSSKPAQQEDHSFDDDIPF